MRRRSCTRRGPHDQRVRQRIVVQRIERRAEARSRGGILQRVVGGDQLDFARRRAAAGCVGQCAAPPRRDVGASDRPEIDGAIPVAGRASAHCVISRCRHAGSASAMPMTSIVSSVASCAATAGRASRSSVCRWRVSQALIGMRSVDRRRCSLRGIEQLLRRARAADGLDDAAAFQPHAAHREMLEQIQIVARDQHRDADFVEAPEDVHDFERQLGIEVAGRLVRDQHRRLAHDGARDADALLLARRQLQRQRSARGPAARPDPAPRARACRFPWCRRRR